MLSELWVSNFAVAERLEATFRPGLNALTGETGTGKSLIVAALDLVLGARASSSLVRRGASEAEIVARFEPGPDAAAGRELPVEDGSLVLRRVVSADGRSRAYVNDRPATVGRLRELGAALADLHGQHEQQNLLREDTHPGYLDAYAGCGKELDRVRKAYLGYVAARDRHLALATESRKSAEEREFLRYQFQELEGAELVRGEEEQLSLERHRAAHAGRLAEAVKEALSLLADDETSGVSFLARASRRLGQGTELDPALEPLRRQVDEALVACEEISRELGTYVDGLTVDPAALQALETRLDLLAGLRRKYNAPVDDLITKREELRQTLDAWEDAPRRLAELEKQVEEADDGLQRACAHLSAARSRASAAFAREVGRELVGLGMDGAKLTVELRPPRRGERLIGRPDPVGPRGAEDAVFLLAANPGEGSGPLGKIASGGEASRVMLALKNVLRRVDPVSMVIFDEVDAGIGGLVAEAVGSRLSAIARQRQVLVVTHLAVIAGRADHHLRLVKRTRGKRTRIEVEELDGDGREAELARMLAGSAGGENARRTARALLAGREQ